MFSSCIVVAKLTRSKRQATAAASAATTTTVAAVRHVRAVPKEGLQGRCVRKERSWLQQVFGLHEQHRVHEDLPWAGPSPPVVPPDHQHHPHECLALSSVRTQRVTKRLCVIARVRIVALVSAFCIHLRRYLVLDIVSKLVCTPHAVEPHKQVEYIHSWAPLPVWHFL